MSFILVIVIIFLVILYKYQINSIFRKTHKEMEIAQSDMISMLRIAEEATGEGFTEKDYQLLKDVFNTKKYFETGYPFLVTKSGDYIIHPTKEGKNQFDSEYHQRRLSFKNGNGYFKYVFKGDDSGRIKWQYFKYFEPYDAFVTVTFFEEELFRELSRIRNFIILNVVLAIFIFFYGIFLMLKPIINSINNIVTNIGEMSKGKIIEKIVLKSKDEIGEIAKSINVLIERNNETAVFADEIGKGNLDAEYSHLGDEDVLGNSLLKMRNSLKLAKEEEEKRSIEVEKQNWASSGLAKFADILRNNNDNIKKLSFNVMSNLINYLNAVQGGIFIINENDPEDIFYELTSAIAYDREKKLKREVRVGEDLVGRAIHEKLTIILKEVPENYMNITSGMGTANPRFVLLVPLLFNEEVYGVIELASFNDFEKHQVEFVEKLSETIASTISSVKINERTARLLEQSQQQSEELLAQEEEMRQNIEELMATQEELKRNQGEEPEEEN